MAEIVFAKQARNRVEERNTAVRAKFYVGLTRSTTRVKLDQVENRSFHFSDSGELRNNRGERV